MRLGPRLVDVSFLYSPPEAATHRTPQVDANVEVTRVTEAPRIGDESIGALKTTGSCALSPLEEREVEQRVLEFIETKYELENWRT